jgi:hydrogenase maturation protein HypF
MGNLENPQTLDDFEHNLELYQRLYRFTPQAIAVDLHPEYFSTRHGHQLARECGLRLVEVQHHHAHIAACLADNGWSVADGAVIGVALDGLGFGDDGGLWGGEFMLADYRAYQRVGRLQPTALPGGERAMLEPWRNLVAQLHTLATSAELQREYAGLDMWHYLAGKPWETLQRMIQNGVNAPPSSSFGRLFDAVGAALGVCRDHISYEGQAASELEALVDRPALLRAQPYPFEIEQAPLLQINPQPMWRAILHDLHQRTNRAHIAARFHATVASMVGVMAHKMRQSHGLDTVALSGGVLQNPSLLTLLRIELEQRGLNILIPRQVPANDGGLALGQAAIAAARINQES